MVCDLENETGVKKVDLLSLRSKKYLLFFFYIMNRREIKKKIILLNHGTIIQKEKACEKISD